MADLLPAALLGAFDTPDALVAAACEARRRKLPGIDAYSPFPVDGLNGPLGIDRPPIATLGLVGGIVGIVSAYAMQAATNLDYPLDIGGRPLLALQSFALIGFELAVLFSVGFMAAGFFILNRLPRYHQPIFDVRSFERASRDRFVLRLAVKNRKGLEAGRAFLRQSGALTIDEVPG